jgi:hypothetical protein
MENRYTGAFEQVEGWWIGHVEELPGCNAELIRHLSFDQPPDRPLQLTWPRDVRVSLAIRGWREVAR